MGSSISYPTDLTDAEWSILVPLIPPAQPGGRPRRQNMRAIVNGLLYGLRGGIRWRLLPPDLPKGKTVYDYFWKWRRAGLWAESNRTLRERVRVASGRKAQPRRRFSIARRGRPHPPAARVVRMAARK
jgi:putative transposase